MKEDHRLPNMEHSILDSNRFKTVSELYHRYSSIRDEIKKDNIYVAWENFVRAYQRDSYVRKNGLSEPNFGDFHYRIEKERSVFEDLALEREQWARICPIDAPNDETKKAWSEEISYWFHEYCIKPWDKRVPNTMMDIFEMVMFSNGVEMWEHPLGVYPTSIPVDRLLPDSNASMDPNEWDIVFYQRYYSLVELWKEVDNEKEAKRNGWDKDAVMRILKNASTIFTDCGDGEIMKLFRSGGVNNAAADLEVMLIHAYVKEYKKVKGKQISLYVFPESMTIPSTGNTAQESIDKSNFVVLKPHFIEKFSNVVALRNHKTHRSYWGCPSMAQLVYVASRFHDQGLNKAIRGAFRQLMLFINTNDPDSQKRIQNLEDQEVHAMNPSDVLQQFRLSVDISQLMELLRQISVETDAGTGANALPGSQNVKGSAITASEAQLIASSSNNAKSSGIRQFIHRDAQLVSEIYRRFVGKKAVPDEPEERMAKAFHKKMEALEIPKEAYEIENVYIESVFSLNAGNAQQKVAVAQAKLAAIRQHSTATTEGERRAIRELLAALDSWANVEYYLSRVGSLEVTEQVHAGIENELLSSPNAKPANVQVTNEDKHNLHIPLHLNDMEASLTFVESLLGQIQNSVPAESMIRIDEITDILVAQDLKGGHVQAHLNLLSQNPTEELMVKKYMDAMGVLRQKESQLENALRQIREQVLASLGTSTLNDEALRHAKEMNAEIERHSATMDNIKLGERLNKSMANQEGADEKHEQNLRHKEADAALKIATETIKLEQKRNDKETSTTGDKE